MPDEHPQSGGEGDPRSGERPDSPDRLAEELEQRTAELQRRAEELEQEIDRAAEEWRRKREDPDVPGARPPRDRR